MAKKETKKGPKKGKGNNGSKTYIVWFAVLAMLSGCSTLGRLAGYTAEGMEEKVVETVSDVIEVLCDKPFEYSAELKRDLRSKGIDIDRMCLMADLEEDIR